MNRILKPIGVSAGLVLVALSAEAQNASADTNWRAIYVQDLKAARSVIESNHPGAVDPRHPEFKATLTSAYQEALRDSAVVTSYASYAIALRRFGNRFQDGHLSVGGTRRVAPLRDAGIFPAWQNGRFIIRAVDERYGADTAALIGASLLLCDGRPASDVFRSRVLSWLGRDKVEADWYRYAPYLLIDYGPPLPAVPALCKIKSTTGERDIKLQWRPIGPTLGQNIRRVNGTVARRLEVTDMPQSNGVWVSIGTFALQSDSLVAAMKGMIDSLRIRVRAARPPAVIVVDLRGNDGGNSQWGGDVAKVLFGDAWFNAASAWLGDGVFAEWRVSDANIAMVQQNLQSAEREGGSGSDAAKYQRRLLEGLSAAKARGAALWPSGSGASGSVPAPRATPLPYRVVVVTDPACFSACLDFMDLMRAHPAVVHVGLTTAVDTDFMENTGTTLPSGLAQIGYPMKVYRNRKRAHNEAYTPAVQFDGAINDTNALREWILSSVLKVR